MMSTTSSAEVPSITAPATGASIAVVVMTRLWRGWRPAGRRSGPVGGGGGDGDPEAQLGPDPADQGDDGDRQTDERQQESDEPEETPAQGQGQSESDGRWRDDPERVSGPTALPGTFAMYMTGT